MEMQAHKDQATIKESENKLKTEAKFILDETKSQIYETTFVDEDLNDAIFSNQSEVSYH
jgi:hypothetical protein